MKRRDWNTGIFLWKGGNGWEEEKEGKEGVGDDRDFSQREGMSEMNGFRRVLILLGGGEARRVIGSVVCGYGVRDKPRKFGHRIFREAKDCA